VVQGVGPEFKPQYHKKKKKKTGSKPGMIVMLLNIVLEVLDSAIGKKKSS
jgi:hypothetical protein